MLPGGHFMVQRLDINPKRGKRVIHFLANRNAFIRRQIEVTRRVMRHRHQFAVIFFEQEKFQFRAGKQFKPHVIRFFDRSFQNVARIALKRVAVGGEHIADKPRRILQPRHHGIGFGIGN